MQATRVTGVALMAAGNQMTLPEPVVEAAGIVEGDLFVIEVTPGDPDTLTLRRVRPSYGGALRDVFGDTTESLETERRTWE